MTNEDLKRMVETDNEGATPDKFVRYTKDAELPGGMLYNIAPKHNEETTYAVDDLVIYKSVLYKATATTTGVFDPSKWTATTIAEILKNEG